MNKFSFGNETCARIGLFAMAALSVLAVSACTNTKKTAKAPDYINTETKFSSKEFGVKGSPRVTTAKTVRKGGGRYQVGKPYTIRGKKYYPKEDPSYVKVGMASWYGPNFHGRLTANGEVYDQFSLSAAHPTMPLPSYARVTNLKNGRSVVVRVNDRGPFAHDRIIDLSARASELLDYQKAGIAKVKVEYVGKARMDGLDEQYLLASYNPGAAGPSGLPDTLLAQAPVPRQPLDSIQPNTLALAATTPGFVPVPTIRPTLYNGIPVDIAGGRPRNGLYGLLQGFTADLDTEQSPIDAVFASVMTDQAPKTLASSEPSLGMKDLVHITFGPFTDLKIASKVEAALEGRGVIETYATSSGEKVLVIAPEMDARHIIADIAALR